VAWRALWTGWWRRLDDGIELMRVLTPAKRAQYGGAAVGREHETSAPTKGCAVRSSAVGGGGRAVRTNRKACGGFGGMLDWLV